jgi:hypothetical protein
MTRTGSHQVDIVELSVCQAKGLKSNYEAFYERKDLMKHVLKKK